MKYVDHSEDVAEIGGGEEKEQNSLNIWNRFYRQRLTLIDQRHQQSNDLRYWKNRKVNKWRM